MRLRVRHHAIHLCAHHYRRDERKQLQAERQYQDAFASLSPQQRSRAMIGGGGRGVFSDAASRDLSAEFGRYRRRLVSAHFADDHALAPVKFVGALTRLYTSADVQRVALSAEEFGGPPFSSRVMTASCAGSTMCANTE